MVADILRWAGEALTLVVVHESESQCVRAVKQHMVNSLRCYGWLHARQVPTPLHHRETSLLTCAAVC